MRYTYMTLAGAVLLSLSQAFAAERTVTLTIKNMTCSACPYIVEKSLAAVPGVTEADVSFEHKTAIVSFDDKQTSVASLITATTKAGYPSQAVAATDAQ
jgi:mercuric ion binding protein